MVLVCFMLLRSSMTTNWGIIQGYCGSWPDTPPWSHQGSTPGPWGARDEPLTCTEKMESRSAVWRALQGKQGGGLPVPLTERPASGESAHVSPSPPPASAPPHHFLVPSPLQLSHRTALPSSHQEGAAESNGHVSKRGTQAPSHALTGRPVLHPRLTLQDPPAPPVSPLSLPTQGPPRLTPLWPWVKFRPRDSSRVIDSLISQPWK